MTDAERLHDIEQKLRCWGYLSHYRMRSVTWLLERLVERDARIFELEARLKQNEWSCRFRERGAAIWGGSKPGAHGRICQNVITKVTETFGVIDAGATTTSVERRTCGRSSSSSSSSWRSRIS